MSADAPVLNEVLRTREDVDAVVRKLSRHVPGSYDGRILQVAMWWWKPAAKLSQKNLAQSWCGLLAKHCGVAHAEMWESICEHLLGTVEVTDPITGRARTTYVSSTTLDTKEKYQHFLNGIEELARTHFDITLPPPNDPAAWQAFRTLKRVRTEEDSTQ